MRHVVSTVLVLTGDDVSIDHKHGFVLNLAPCSARACGRGLHLYTSVHSAGLACFGWGPWRRGAGSTASYRRR